ncbi:Sec34-like family-domain-containing protein [Chytriomyces sp. MP71]|nr:Sec34-like family-domain-containing protein [Chytriomyces sp. MP71]
MNWNGSNARLSAEQSDSMDILAQFASNVFGSPNARRPEVNSVTSIGVDVDSAKAGTNNAKANTPLDVSNGTVNTTPGGVDVHSAKTVQTIATTADFMAWFSALEQSMEQQHEQQYWAFLNAIRERLEHCDFLIALVDNVALLIDQQHESFDFVESRTEALKRECQSLLKEQQDLEHLSQELEDRLIKFNVLEPAVRLFNGTGVDGVVLDTEFVPMLARLDDSLAFVEDHKLYKDAELYRMKFRQCITRGLTLIKMHFVSSMRALGDDIVRVLAERENPAILPAQSLQTALLYAKFKAVADSSLRGLVAEIEARIPSHSEYYGLLGECLDAYFGVRKQLVSAGVSKTVDGFLAESTDVLQVAKNGAAYIMSLSADECGLFSQYFKLGEAELVQYLDELSVSLYDHLRPRIVREQRIDVLADLCRSLYLHLESVDNLTAANDGGGINGALSPTTTVASSSRVVPKGDAAPVKYVVGKILEDAQERLAFRAAEYIRQEIELFSPKDRELDVFVRSKKLPIPNSMLAQANMVPDLVPQLEADPSTFSVLENDVLVQEPTSTIDESVESATKLSKSSSKSLSDEALQRTISSGKLVYGSGEWYPTLHKALYILGKLYRAVPRAIFEDLAQEALDLCRKSMISAGELIGMKTTRLDGQFFIIKNLLMFREQIAPFDSTFVRKEDVIDFSAISDALTNIFQNKWGLTNLPTLGLTFLTTQLPSMLVPRLVENISKDSKLSVNLSLKQTCEDMILDTVKACVEPVSSFMIKVTAFRLKSAKGGGERLGMQAFASPQRCVEVSNAFAQSVQAKIGIVVAKMGDYLGDKRTEAVLLLHIKGNIVESYSSFHSVVVAEHSSLVLEGVLSVDDISSLIDVCCAQSMRFI